ncbi:MAG TPA: alkaline phosphatase D family protein [Thermomonospora sp.]|nr:alkaline phosphatase D family protein [Thermomonospora sp.]
MATLSYGWVGGTTASTARFTLRTVDAASVRIVLSASPNLAQPVHGAPQVPDARGLTKHELSGLTAATAYHWGVEADGVLLPERGRFRTLPVPGTPSDFTFCFGGDRIMSSNHVVYDTIRGMDPLQFLFLGDLHYWDVDSPDRAEYDLRNSQALSTPRYARLLREVPTVHTWDNHDFTGANGWSGSVGAAAAQESMRAHGTFYPLPPTGLYCTWVVGRCRFIMLDTRSGRSNPADPDGASKSLLGAVQKEWYLDLLNRSTEPVIFVGESIPHRYSAVGGDRWGDYRTEFQEINRFVNTLALGRRMVLLSADMHAIAADDGRNSLIGAMELVGAPLDQSGGGGSTWQVGPIVPPAGTGQFGRVSVADDGTEITVTFTGHDHTGAQVATLAKTFAAPSGPPDPDSTLRTRTADGWHITPARTGLSWRGTASARAWQGERWS